MSDKRRWSRFEPKGLVSKTAKLMFVAGLPSIECRVVDLSAGGACLELPRQQEGLPSEFEILHGGVRRPCRLAWKRGFRIGCQYTGSFRR
jgi:hypothetical protein